MSQRRNSVSGAGRFNNTIICIYRNWVTGSSPSGHHDDEKHDDNKAPYVVMPSMPEKAMAPSEWKIKCDVISSVASEIQVALSKRPAISL
jgi:hypothetical protein